MNSHLNSKTFFDTECKMEEKQTIRGGLTLPRTNRGESYLATNQQGGVLPCHEPTGGSLTLPQTNRGSLTLSDNQGESYLVTENQGGVLTCHRQSG